MARKIKVKESSLTSNQQLSKKTNKSLPIWVIILIAFFVIPFALGMFTAIISPIINGFLSDKNSHENKIRNEMKCSKHVLSFRDIYDNLLMTSNILSGAGVDTKDGMPVVSLQIKDKDKFYEVTKKVSEMGENANYIVIWLDYDMSKGDQFLIYNEESDSLSLDPTWCSETKLHNDHGTCISAATVNEAFSNDVIIQGDFTLEEATVLAELINCSLK